MSSIAAALSLNSLGHLTFLSISGSHSLIPHPLEPSVSPSFVVSLPSLSQPPKSGNDSFSSFSTLRLLPGLGSSFTTAQASSQLPSEVTLGSFSSEALPGLSSIKARSLEPHWEQCSWAPSFYFPLCLRSLFSLYPHFVQALPVSHHLYLISICFTIQLVISDLPPWPSPLLLAASVPPLDTLVGKHYQEPCWLDIGSQKIEMLVTMHFWTGMISWVGKVGRHTYHFWCWDLEVRESIHRLGYPYHWEEKWRNGLPATYHTGTGQGSESVTTMGPSDAWD